MKQPGGKPRLALWVGFLAAVVPLVVLVALQSRWLGDLEKSSTLARQDLLSSMAHELTDDLDRRMRVLSLDSLKLPPIEAPEEDWYYRVLRHFEAHPAPEAKHLFFVHYVQEPTWSMLPWWYDPERGDFFGFRSERLQSRFSADEFQATMMAASLWNILGYNQQVIRDPELEGDHRKGERVLLLPILDTDSVIIGITGLILDMDYYAGTFLPLALRGCLEERYGEQAGAFAIEVLDRDRQVVLRIGEVEGDYGTRFREGVTGRSLPLPLALSDWSLRLSGPVPDGKRFASTNARLNFALLVFLVLSLLGGVLMAFRAASQAMRLSQMKSDFVSNVSHELRTPLASVRVFGELLRLGKVDDPAKVREYGEYIETESRRLSHLVNNILDFSHIESGAKSYRFELADLTEVVEEALELFSVRLRQRGFRVAFERPDEPVPVRVDPAALAQSVSNLLDNAVKFSGDSREITVRVERLGDEAVVSVRDWGIGVPRAEQGKIFERFHRVSTGLVHDVRGSGLGLSIVHHIARAHGGRVSVTSRSGHGSTFRLHLPLAPSDPAGDSSNTAMEF